MPIAARRAAPATLLALLAPQAEDTAAALFAAATALARRLDAGRPLDPASLRAALQAATGRSDAAGGWAWKDAYDAAEAAQVLFLGRHGPALRPHLAAPQRLLAMLDRLAALGPSQTRRSEAGQALQQFSTPLPLAFAAARAARLAPGDRVLEPSAGTGLLAAGARLAGGPGLSLILNELADARAGLLDRLFPGTPVTRLDGAQIDDRLAPDLVPTVVLMNPPFSASAGCAGRDPAAAARHVAAALARLAPGGRLVAITPLALAPAAPAWRDGLAGLLEHARVVFSAGLAAAAYARHGTATATRLTVLDRLPAADPHALPDAHATVASVAELLDLVERHVPPRPGPPGAPAPRPGEPLPAAAAAAAAPDAPVPLRPAPGVAERMILDAPDAAAIRVGDADLHRGRAARLRRALPDLAARLAREPVDVVEWLPPLLAPEVALPSGGRLTVEQTRALTAIDVDTGAARSALPTDLEAAAEAARQLRLRNIGGLVVIDFVSEAPAARSQVLDRLRAALKGDPAQVRLGGATALGLVELARERRGFGLAEATRSGGGL